MTALCGAPGESSSPGGADAAWRRWRRRHHHCLPWRSRRRRDGSCNGKRRKKKLPNIYLLFTRLLLVFLPVVGSLHGCELKFVDSFEFWEWIASRGVGRVLWRTFGRIRLAGVSFFYKSTCRRVSFFQGGSLAAPAGWTAPGVMTPVRLCSSRWSFSILGSQASLPMVTTQSPNGVRWFCVHRHRSRTSSFRSQTGVPTATCGTILTWRPCRWLLSLMLAFSVSRGDLCQSMFVTYEAGPGVLAASYDRERGTDFSWWLLLVLHHRFTFYVDPGSSVFCTIPGSTLDKSHTSVSEVFEEFHADFGVAR